MNLIRIITVMTLSFATGTVLAQGLSSGRNNNNNKDSYKAGNGEEVKKWTAKSMEDAKKSGLPICVYIFDPANKNNPRAKLLEGGEGIGGADAKDKLKKFYCLKLSVASATDSAKGWPAEWFSRAKDSAAVFLLSSDFTQIRMFDKEIPKESITAENTELAIGFILQYEEKKKAQAAKNPAPPPAGAVANANKQPGAVPPAMKN